MGSGTGSADITSESGSSADDDASLEPRDDDAHVVCINGNGKDEIKNGEECSVERSK